MEPSEATSTADEFYRRLNRSVQEDVTDTVLGKTKTLAGLERNEWIFLMLSVLCFLTTTGLTIDSLVILTVDSADFVFAILLVINAGFCLFYAVHGVLREREYELYCLITAILFVSVYVVVNFGVTFPSSSIKKARFVLIVVLVPFIIYYAWVVGKGFGYLEFRTVGAVAEVQAMYRAASRFSGLLKFDYQLAVILLVLTIEDCRHVSYFSKCSLAAGIPLQMLAALVGWMAMRTEQLLLVWLFLPLCVAEPIYIGFRISQFADNWKYYSNELENLTYSFIAAAGCAIIVRVLLVLALYIVVKNFGRGLKFKVFHLPVDKDSRPPVLLRKREMKECCGVVCCGPLG